MGDRLPWILRNRNHLLSEGATVSRQEALELVEYHDATISSLTSTVERLTKALEPFANAEALFSVGEQPLRSSGFIDVRMNRECFRNAAQALKEARDGN